MSSESAQGVAGMATPSAYFDFTPDLLSHFPLSELSCALRSQIESIVTNWTAEISRGVPAATRLPFEHLADNLPGILNALADALGSLDPEVRRELLRRSPSQGINRFQQHYDTHDLMLEDRILRVLVVRDVEEALGRRMTQIEHVALCMGLDLMSQQAVVAYVEHQAVQLRAAAEAELRYLSFLSHDLKNNLAGVTVWLQALHMQLLARAEMQDEAQSVEAIQQSILRTMGGMGRLLQAEQLRHSGALPKLKRVDLRQIVSHQTRFFAEQALHRGVQIRVDVPKDSFIMSDEDLLTLVLQNLIGNAIKYGVPGDVTVQARQMDDAGQPWKISVIDQGPGIPPEQCERIFRAFERGTMQGEAGIGLGLAIASRAASLLGGKLSVDSKVGSGSTFSLLLST